MASQLFKIITFMSAFLIGLVACGGGGTQVAGGGIGGTGISQGSITGFGSVWVNGIEFDTANAIISRDGTPVVQSDLAIGMVVTVDGSVNSDGVSGTATSVSYNKELQGPISDIPNNNSLIVLGQTIIVDDLTKITVNGADAAIADLHTGDTVEVSGFLATNGIRASYIEKKSSSTDVELKGIISAINGSIISIGSQNIDISSVPSYTPTLGDYVEVKATVGTTLYASSIEKKSHGLGNGTNERTELEGFVTSVTPSSEFKVNGQLVQTTAQTVISGGAVTDIATGVRLEVKGALSNGVLVATRISFEDQLTLEGNVDPSSTGNTIFLVTYPGIPIEINDILTEGASNQHNVGDYVKIRGRKLDPTCTTSACTLLATELEYVASGGGSAGGGSSGGTLIESHVIVDALDKSNQTITVLGSVLNVSEIPTISGQDSAGNEITTIGQFFATVKVGDVVDLKGTNTNGTITWQEIELED